MKKIKFIFSLLIALVILIGLSTKSSAITISTTETPKTVDSEQEFEITIKFDNKVNGWNAYMTYDSDLIEPVMVKNETTGEVSDSIEASSNLTATKIEDDSEIAMIYYNSSKTATEDSFYIKVKAKKVTEEKVANFELYGIKAQEDSTEEELENQKFSVTIKPVEETENGLTLSETEVKLKVGETKSITATGTGTLTWKSSDENIATVDQTGKITGIKAGTATITVTDENGKSKTITVTVTDVETAKTNNTDTTVAKTSHPQTGESKFIVLAISIILTIAIIFGVKSNKIKKLFVMLPILVAVAISAEPSEAKTISTDDLRVGFVKEEYLKDRNESDSVTDNKVIGVSITREWELKENDSVTKADLDEFFTINNITPTGILRDDVDKGTDDTLKLSTGDIIKTDSEEYLLVIYGDVAELPAMCSAADCRAIAEDFCKITDELTGANYLAADINYDNELNIFDVMRMVYKYVGQENYWGTDDTSWEYQNLIDTDVFGLEDEKENSYYELTSNGTISYYDTLNEALASTSTGENTIKVLKDRTETVEATLAEGKTATLDLNGKTITLSGISLVNKGNLTITGAEGTLTGDARNTIKNEGTGNLTITSGNIANSVAGTIINSGTGKVQVNGGSITSYRKIGSGTYMSSAIENDSTGTIEITAGQLAGGLAGIYNIGNGNIKVTGGTVEATGDEINDNAEAGIYNYGTAATIEITGGTISCKGGFGIYSNNGKNNVLIITGGTVENGIETGADGTFTLGIDDGTVNTESPKIIGGVSIGTGVTFNFYDGIIEATATEAINGATATGTVIVTPTGYEIKTTTDTVDDVTTATAILVKQE